MQLSWFPFFLFDTDWMGREVYHGDPKGDDSAVKLYNQGVREGAFGLLLNSVRLKIDFSSFICSLNLSGFTIFLLFFPSAVLVYLL